VEFVKAQEGCRKDVERAFGVLQQKFAVVRFPSFFFAVPLFELVQRSDVGGDELLCVLTQHDY
jgi:hypothetical protein